MSMNAYWEPWKPKPRAIKTTSLTDSDFIQKLINAFGFNKRGVYDEDDLTILKAMATVCEDYQQLVNAIEQHGQIRVWGEI